MMDPAHTSFLHGQSSGVQFSKGFAEVGELEFFERGLQYLGCNTRRVDDFVWVRVNELILPNFTQAGSAFAADGSPKILISPVSLVTVIASPMGPFKNGAAKPAIFALVISALPLVRSFSLTTTPGERKTTMFIS